MKIGFIGAGKAACNLGKYFSVNERAGIELTGFYSLYEEDARWAAEFTKSNCFVNMDDVLETSDSIILSTPDGAVKDVWNTINKEQIDGKIICHLSGSLSSDVFSGIGEYGAYPISIHPMFAFSGKDSVYKELKNASFTLEGHQAAVSAWLLVFQKLGNHAIPISKEAKPKYHAAASILSNYVVAVLHTGYSLLQDCGFSPEEARSFSRILVENNVNHVMEQGTIEALTGPVERGDLNTVRKHLSVLEGDSKEIYLACGKTLVEIAKQKNQNLDYDEMEKIFKGEIQ